ncbi:DUF305 domain-containing protein [Streptomyces sp. TG1A-8]|uniref:DUF305 domain-containing protein n=1 Tax=Streptomyces sp. TG1A-8 TaxID=3051385 RepID=UPI00265C7CB7|nr:DUF305 domain-containing protein [Streptomyces sp. TG1A-8]MDO0929425.1 DUF305 domain-containing protein [Streptomyces sp. TG1A-8]
MQLRRRVLILRALGVLLAALPAAGCTAQPAAGPPRAAAFNPTDTAWIQLMIPMDERARLLTGLAPARAGDPALARLAARADAGLEDDLAGLRRLMELSGVPDTRPHEGHDMPGMVTLGAVRRAGTATGKEFDRIFTDSLRAHLAQSRKLCASERTSGGAEEAGRLAAAIGGRAAELITRLDALR